MDSVRFGRALGMGTKAAARAVVMAAEAAAARPAAPQPGQTRPATRVAETAASTAARVRETTAGVARGSSRFGQAAWEPVARLSGVLWLEFTGVFFGLFFLTALASCWKLRSNLYQTPLNHVAHQHLLWSVVVAVVFGYFCVSSFLRAGRRQRAR